MANPETAKSNLTGIGYMILGAGSFVLNDSLMKLALADLPSFEVLALRGIFGAICLIPLLALTGQLRALPQGLNRWVMLRGLLEVGAILAFITSLANAPIADITAIFQTAPLLIVLGMVIFFGEKLDGLRFAFILLGFVGALLVAQPGSEGSTPYALLAFATAGFAASRDLIARHIPGSTPVLVSTMTTVLLVLLAAIGAGLLFESWAMPTSRHFVMMLVAGFLMTLGHAFTFLAYRHAQAQAVAPFYYSFMPWALISGYLLFDTLPNSLALLGMLVILVSGLAVIYLEQRNRTDLPKSMATGHE